MTSKLYCFKEPGANVEDQIIDVVAEAPKPPTPPPPIVKKKKQEHVQRRPSHPKVSTLHRSDTTDLSKSANLEEIVNSVIHESKQPVEPSISTTSDIILEQSSVVFHME